MKRDAGDILDRWSIAKLKSERIGTEDNKKEYEAFCRALVKLTDKHSRIPWSMMKSLMVFVNASIWQLESGLKSGKEELDEPEYLFDPNNEMTLSRIGIMTILIRNFNHIRVQLKNILNTIVKEGYMDIKSDHLSEGVDNASHRKSR